MAAAKLCQTQKMNPSHLLKAAAASPSIQPYAMGLAILLMLILRSMKYSKQNWREVLQVLSLSPNFETIKIK